MKKFHFGFYIKEQYFSSSKIDTPEKSATYFNFTIFQALRIRPISKKEIESGCDQVLDVVPGRSQIYIKNSQKAFTYDYAYSTDSEQDSIYDKSVQPLVDKLFKGK